jgi:hypothetical protein
LPREIKSLADQSKTARRPLRLNRPVRVHRGRGGPPRTAACSVDSGDRPAGSQCTTGGPPRTAACSVDLQWPQQAVCRGQIRLRVGLLVIAPALLPRLDRHKRSKRPPLVRVLVQAHLADRSLACSRSCTHCESFPLRSLFQASTFPWPGRVAATLTLRLVGSGTRSDCSIGIDQPASGVD